MKPHPLLVALTVVNVIVLAVILLQQQTSLAQNTAPVLRGRALEIVDDRGQVRASITLVPANSTFRMPDGTIGYPETVLFRLIDQNGRPNVKIGASSEGAGVGLGGETDPTYIQIIAQRASTLLKLTNKDGRQQVIQP